ncbi:hypothetical protein V1291_001466 [Nitrobacteraceae bacterium AZCC 1564]
MREYVGPCHTVNRIAIEVICISGLICGSRRGGARGRSIILNRKPLVLPESELTLTIRNYLELYIEQKPGYEINVISPRSLKPSWPFI